MKTRLRLLIAITIMASLNIVNAASHSAFANVMHETVESVLASAVQVTAGYEHTCALTIMGGVKCWGSNYILQLGDGSNRDRTTPVDVIGLSSGVKAVSAGNDHTCALTIMGGVKCWGYNYLLNYGTAVVPAGTRPIDVIGLTSGVKAISVGGVHTCALMNTGSVKCWGSNGYGQLGDGTQTFRTAAVDVSGLASGVIEISAGFTHTCALMITGGVKCWGSNGSGELGDGTETSRTTPTDVIGLISGAKAVSAGYQHTCAVMTTGSAKCWGSNFDYQLGLGDGGPRMSTTPVVVSGLSSGVIEISAGYWQTCAVLNTGGAKCWGNNDRGNLGDGTTTPRNRPVDVSGLTTGVAKISVGRGRWHHVCALMNNNAVVKCWGANWLGQLGDGTTTDRITPVDVIGLDGGSVTPTTPAPTTPAPTTPAPSTPAPSTPAPTTPATNANFDASFTSPLQGATVGPSSILLKANVTAKYGVGSVEFRSFYDGHWHSAGLVSQPPYEVIWETPPLLRSQIVSFAVKIYDQRGNVFDSAAFRSVDYRESLGNPQVKENWIPSRFYLNQRALLPKGDCMCSAASMSMVLASLGLVSNDFEAMSKTAGDMYPHVVTKPPCDFAVWAKIAPEMIRQGQLAGKPINATLVRANSVSAWRIVKSEIDLGNPVILRTKNLTRSGHVIVAVGYRESGEKKEAIIYDPYGAWKGYVGAYDANVKYNDSAQKSIDSHKGLWRFYDFDTIFNDRLVTARRSESVLFAKLQTGTPLTPPDNISDEPESLVNFDGVNDEIRTETFLPIVLRLR